MFLAQLFAWLTAHHHAHLAGLLFTADAGRAIAWAARHGFTYQP